MNFPDLRRVGRLGGHHKESCPAARSFAAPNPPSPEPLASRAEAPEAGPVATARPNELAPIVWKDWRKAIGVVTDLEGFALVAAAGAAIRQAERDDASADLTEGDESAGMVVGSCRNTKGSAVSEPVTLETLSRRLESVEAQLAAKGPPAAPRWMAGLDAFDQSEEAVAFRKQIDEEVRKARDAERAELGLDAPEVAREGAE